MSLLPIILSNKAWVPKESIKDTTKLDHLYVHNIYDDKSCQKCEYLEERHCDVCDNCPAFTGSYKLYKEIEIKGHPYVGVPKGNRDKIREITNIRDSPIIDKRPSVPMKNSWDFNYKALNSGEYGKYQPQAVEAVASKTYGILKSAPRTGKTIMTAAVIHKLGGKTLILAHQGDLHKQFYATFMNPAFTDIADREKFTGIKIVGICDKLVDFDRFDICLATYQQFLSPGGKRKLEKIKNKFTNIFVDECHRAPADCYAKVISRFNCRRLIGLTATDGRKDGKFVIIKDMIGGVIHQTKTKMVIPTVYLHESGAVYFREQIHWTYLTLFLSKHKKRNSLIADLAVKRLHQGHCVLIPVTFVAHASTLVDLINDRFGEAVAGQFTGRVFGSNKGGESKREKFLQSARQGNIRCVVAMRSMLTGIDIPRWSNLIEVMPISNPLNMEQETFRILTPIHKPAAVIDHIVDNIHICRACFRTCLYQTYVKFKFNIPPETKAHALKHMAPLRSKTVEHDEYADSASTTAFTPHVSSYDSDDKMGKHF